MPIGSLPPAFAALDRYPSLRRQVAAAASAQTLRIAERDAAFVPRPEVVAELDARLADIETGTIAFEGPPGSGVTSLFCHLAATRPYPVWLPSDDGGDGLRALCAQLIALYDLPVPVVPPAADRDALTLERLLAEAAGHAGGPLVILIDQQPDGDTTPAPPPLPAVIPPGVVLVRGPWAREGLPAPAASIVLPTGGPILERLLTDIAATLSCEPDLATQIVELSQGSPLYVRLACGLMRTGLLRRNLPRGLDALYDAWWQEQNASGRRVALALAAANEPLSVSTLAAVSRTTPAVISRLARRWQPLLEHRDDTLRLAHPSLTTFVAAQSGDQLESTHTVFVTLARTLAGDRFEQLNPQADGYMLRQLARHIALSGHATRAASAELASRAWALAQQRRTGDLRAVARDAAWILRVATAEGLPIRLVRAAALAGTLATLGRSLPADALVEAFNLTLERGTGREATLRRARSLVNQLPDGRDKAAVLRRLGEVCHDQRMRAPAMRMLSEALDLEVAGVPRPWRDEREEMFVTFARAAIAAGAPDIALGITVRINHIERRGLIETEVVRWLLSHGLLTRAEEVAYAISHESMHEWAMAEVAVTQARAGNPGRAAVVLGTLKTETAVAWARGELAVDLARAGDAGAAEQVQAITNQRLRDRALAAVMLGLAAGGNLTAALDISTRIDDRETRARALIDLALQEAGATRVAPAGSGTALDRAAVDIATLGDDRLPLVVALAAAYASCGNTDAALQTARMLAEGEERDRAHSRVAVALARRGDITAAQLIADTIPDTDERSWTYHELARLLADRPQAHALIERIADLDVQAHARADLYINRAYAGDAAVAMMQATRIEAPGERLRACIAIVEPLVRQGGAAAAQLVQSQFSDADAQSRYQAALVLALAPGLDRHTAHRLAGTIARPQDRARAWVGIARAAQGAEPFDALSQALLAVTPLGRTETLHCLGQASDVLVALAGADLLLATAHAIDEIDGWWW